MGYREKSKLNVLKICLTVFLLLNTISCAGVDPYPEVFYYEIQLDTKVCGKYALADQRRVIFKHIEDLPFEKCPKYLFGLDADGATSVTGWVRSILRKKKR